MRFRTGLVVGLGVGYYLGTRADQDRIERLDRMLDRVRATAAYRDARIRVNEGLRDSTDVARRLLDEAAGSTPPWRGLRPTPEGTHGDPSWN